MFIHINMAFPTYILLCILSVSLILNVSFTKAEIFVCFVLSSDSSGPNEEVREDCQTKSIVFLFTTLSSPEHKVLLTKICGKNEYCFHLELQLSNWTTKAAGKGDKRSPREPLQQKSLISR
jgi:hypothetical protein